MPPPEAAILTRAQCRELDRLARDEFGIPTILLMENAGRHLADAARDLLGGVVDGRDVLILCGPGNNGGDGLVAARHLHNEGARVRIVLAGEAARGDARVNLDIAVKMGLDPGFSTGTPPDGGRPDLVIDALLGTGLDRPIEGVLAEFVALANGLGEGGCPILSADIPSGLHADTGAVLGCAVRAEATVTFAALKPGFLSLGAQEYLGRVLVRDVGHPRELLHRLAAMSAARTPGREGSPPVEPEPAPRRRER